MTVREREVQYKPSRTFCDRALPLAFALLFILQGLWFIPLAGIQEDEALFARAVYVPGTVDYHWHFRRTHIPVMLMSYVGATKAWLYKPILKLFGPSVWSLRVPVVLLGGMAVSLIFVLLRQTAGLRTAIAAAALLATDPMLILTSCFDWGPVVLQHFLQAAAMLLFVYFARTGSNPLLFAASFLLGVALWNKAIFIWTLAGLGLATVVVFRSEVVRLITKKRIALVLCGFLLGSFPLWEFNSKRSFETFRSNAAFSPREIPEKVAGARYAFDGSALFGYIMSSDYSWKENPGPVRISNFPEWLSVRFGAHHTLSFYAFLLGTLLAIPLLFTSIRRILLFSAGVTAVTWVLMAGVPGAGGSAHHVILLWPFPQMLMAAVLAYGSRFLGRAGKVVFVTALSVLCCSQLLVTNEHHVQLIRAGSYGSWTDADRATADYIAKLHPPLVGVNDWGIGNFLVLLNRGRIPVSYSFLATEDRADQEQSRKYLQTPGLVIVGHLEGHEELTGVNARLMALAQRNGYRKELIHIVEDTHARPVFEVFRLVPTRSDTTAPAW